MKTLLQNFTAFIGFVLLSCHAQAQQVTAQVMITQAPALNPSLTLLHLPDSAIVKSVVVKDVETNLLLEQGGHYLLRVTASGRSGIEKEFTALNAPFTLTIDLDEKVDKLENVVVLSRKPLMRFEDDKTIVDAEVLANSSTNAYEVLEKTPGAIVDQDGNVYLNSATPAIIYINGREMKLSATDLASLLKSLPSNSITRIEILRTPSAKYDAASSGGIVNIVLKKGIKLGTNGSANLAFFRGKYNTFTVGLNGNKIQGKLNSYFSYQYSDRNNYEELNSIRIITTDTSLVKQDAYTTYPSTNHYGSLGLDYALNEKWTIGYDFRLSLNDGSSSAINNNSILKGLDLMAVADIRSLTSNKSNTVFAGNNMNLKYKIDSLGSEWTLASDFNSYRSGNKQFYSNNFVLPNRPSLNGDGNTENNKNIFTVTTDLVKKLEGSLTIETGGKYNSSDSKNEALYYLDIAPDPRKTDSFQTNRFTYNEKISAGYIQVAKTFSGITLKPGLRLERTDIAGRQLFPVDTALSIRRTDLFPYVYARRNITKLFGFLLTGNAIFRKSITRPYYEALNPYPKYIDPFLYDVGNPRLKPQFTTNYEVNVTALDFPVFSMGINDIKDIFTNVTYQHPISRIAYRTYDNLGRNKEFYLRLAGGIPPGRKYFFYLAAQHNRSHYTGLYQDKPFEYTRGSWVLFTYHNLKATPTLTLSMHGFWRINGLQNFYELRNFGAMNVSINKAVLKKKGNIILSFNDVLGTNKIQFNLQQSGIDAYGIRQNDNRKAGLTFRYNFGVKAKEERKGFMGMPAENGVN